MPFKFNPLSGSLDYYSTPIQINPVDPNDPGIPSNGLIIEDGLIKLTLASETTPGTITAQDYVEFKTKKEYKTVTETKILTTLEVADKKIILSNIPSFPETTMLSLAGGTLQRYGVDYVVINQDLSWDGLELDNFLEPGDELRIYYQTE
jgi:hypothetical protein